MVVIVIIGLLATIVVPNVLGKWREAAIAKARADITTLANALTEYAVKHAGQYPDSLTVLVTPDAEGHTELSSRELPRDPWGSEYVYEAPVPAAGEPRPHVVSWGPDKQPGTADDLDNWTPAPR